MTKFNESEYRIALNKWKSKYGDNGIKILSDWERTKNLILCIGNHFSDY